MKRKRKKPAGWSVRVRALSMESETFTTGGGIHYTARLVSPRKRRK